MMAMNYHINYSTFMLTSVFCAGAMNGWLWRLCVIGYCSVVILCDCVSGQEVDKRLIPKTECLKDTLKRVLPYWQNNIVPEI